MTLREQAFLSWVWVFSLSCASPMAAVQKGGQAPEQAPGQSRAEEQTNQVAENHSGVTEPARDAEAPPSAVDNSSADGVALVGASAAPEQADAAPLETEHPVDPVIPPPPADPLETASDNAKEAFSAAVDLVQKGDAEQDAAILVSLKQAVQESPQHYLAQYDVGAMYLKERKWGEARAAFEAALRAKPQFGPAVVGLATILAQNGETQRAEELLREKVDQIEDSGDLLAAYAQFLARAGNVDEAKSRAVAALRLDERSAHASLALGMVFRRQKKLELSIMALSQAIEIDPSLGEAYNELGLVYVALDDKVRAVQAFERASQTSDAASVHNNLGMLRNEVGAFRLAIASLERAVEREPSRAEYYLNLGTAYRGDQRYVEAEAAYKKALSVGGGSPRAHFNIAILNLDNELPDKTDVTTRYQLVLEHFEAYRQKVVLGKEEQVVLDEYAAAAKDEIDREEKRRERKHKQEEKEREKALKKQREQEQEAAAKAAEEAAVVPSANADPGTGAQPASDPPNVIEPASEAVVPPPGELLEQPPPAADQAPADGEPGGGP